MDFARSGRAEIAYDVTGRDDGAPVLFIHAGVNDRRSWDPLIAHLGDGFRGVAYDQRTFGETRYEPEPGWQLTGDALAVMDDAGLIRPVVIACSMGGLVALDLAFLHPERVAGLILIGPGVSGAPRPEPTSDGPAARLFAAVAAADEAGDVEELLRLHARMFLDGPTAPEGRVSGPVRDHFMAMDRRNELAEHPGDPAETEGVWPRLEKITTPTLVLTGRLDVEHLLVLNPELARRLPNGRHAWLDGVAHVPHMEGDPATLQAITAFLAELGDEVRS